MTRYEIDELEEFLTAISEGKCKRVGLKSMIVNGDKEGNQVQLILVAAASTPHVPNEPQDHFYYQEASDLYPKEELAKVQEMEDKVKKEVIKQIQEECPEAIIFHGKVLP